MNETPTPPEGYRIIPRAYLEAGNPLPEDALWRTSYLYEDDSWSRCPLLNRILRERIISEFVFATAQPLPCFQSPDQGQWTEGKHAFPPERVAPEPKQIAAEFISCEGNTDEAQWLRSNAQDALAELEVIQTEKLAAAGLVKEASAVSAARVTLDSALALKCGVQPTAGIAELPLEEPEGLEESDNLARYKEQTRNVNVGRYTGDERDAQLTIARKIVEKLEARIAELEREVESVRHCGNEERRRLTKERDEARRDCTIAVETLKDKCKTLEAQLAESEKDRQWRPIENAPRDGTKFLVWEVDFKAHRIAWWRKHRGTFGDDCYQYNFAHWLPLRVAPTQSETL